MANSPTYMPAPQMPQPTKDWEYYQFQYCDGECVAVVAPIGGLKAFYVNKDGTLRPTTHIKIVKPGPADFRGEFQLTINRSTQVAMKHCADGVARGTREHWGGQWTNVLTFDMRTAHQKASAGWQDVPPAPVGRPWGRSAPVMEPPHFPHPSGLPDHMLEDCKACASSYGACVECYNTGRVPKTQREDKHPMKDMIATIQIAKGAKVVAVAFLNNPNGASYHYKNVLGIALAAEDLVVVQVRNGEYTLAKVTNPDVMACDISCALGDLKHVVTKVDMSGLKAVLEAENNAMHALALSEVTERMHKFKEQIGAATFDTMQSLLSPPANKE